MRNVVVSTALLLWFALLSGNAVAQPAKNHPFDGMSAVDIAVAARMYKAADNSLTQAAVANSPAAPLSPVDFHRVDIVELKGRFMHEGWYPIPGDPLPGTVTVEAELLGPWKTAQFKLVSETDEFIQDISLSVDQETLDERHLLGTMEVPDQPFKVAVSGVDSNDSPFAVTQPKVFRPQLVEVRFESPFYLVDAGVIDLSLSITNHGPLDTFLIFVEDDMNVGVTSQDSEIQLDLDETGITNISLNVPNISMGNLDIVVTATATGLNIPSNTNYGTTLARVQKFNLIQVDGFESGQP